MTDPALPAADLPPPPPPAPPIALGPVAPEPAADVPWQRLPAAARGVFQGGGAITGAIFAMPAYLGLGAEFFEGWLMWLGMLVVIPLLGAAAGFWIATRRWASSFWRLDERGLQVRRGAMFNREVFVPRSRVQHLDLERGPIERHFGLATIVVHTAGTRLQALRQSGLAEADAVALRDALVPATDADDDAV